jgi:hypothetical protein
MATKHSPKGAHLTPSQKAEAAAMWMAGDHTIAAIAKKYGKRPESIGRIFKAMGVTKGSAKEDLTAKATALIEAKMLGSVEEHARRIMATREQHFKMSDGLAKLAWTELVRARQAGLDLGGLKDVMQTLKLAGEVIGQARKELWSVLGVEEHDKDKELESLPELMVRELTQAEVGELHMAQEEDEMGAEMAADLDSAAK